MSDVVWACAHILQGQVCLGRHGMRAKNRRPCVVGIALGKKSEDSETHAVCTARKSVSLCVFR